MIATVVVAHPAREVQAKQLAADHDGIVVMDTEGRGAGGNHREALRVGIETGASHVLSLEDDAVPVPGLLGHVAEAVRRRPDQILGLYVGRQRPRSFVDRVAAATRKADQTGASWLTYPGLIWGVAAVWPAHLAREFLTFSHGTNLWDVHVRRWCERHGHEVAFTWPSLCDHRDEGTVITGRLTRPPGRVAHRVGVPDWNDRAVAL